MKNRKYRLVNQQRMKPTDRGGFIFKKRFYQLQALIDIPLHGVKAGDLGGFVSNKKILSHEGSCWIGGTAKIYKHARVIDDAYVGGTVKIFNDFGNSMITISESAKVLGDVEVSIYTFTSSSKAKKDKSIQISGHAIISGNVAISNNSIINDHASISGNVKLDRCTVAGGTIVKDNVTMGANANISGNSHLSGEADLGDNVTLNNCVVSGKAQISDNSSFSDHLFEKDAIFKSQETPVVIVDTHKGKSTSPNEQIQLNSDQKVTENERLNKVNQYFEEVMSKIDAYQTDIVKIIKYPLMTEKTDSCTIAMTLALNKATRLSMDTALPENLIAFHDAIEDLETKFILAESNALKMANTLLSEAEIKKTTKASDLFRLASNEAASEQEKKVAFIQGFKQLEGILVVPEEAVMNFQAKIGLKKIEA